ncbi:hypothetical protein LCGC14_1915860 [marine sediment metagenome]|uniref:Peptidase M48 domain-containing protein n=1 Tax=marine sediment metagenome TaxID=412755 RepID=A0A0F9FT10_9ZZZZ
MVATVAFNISALKELDDHDLEVVVVHEMCHVLVNEMRADRGGEPTHGSVAHEERVVSTLAQAFLTVRDQGEREGRKAARRKKK